MIELLIVITELCSDKAEPKPAIFPENVVFEKFILA